MSRDNVINFRPARHSPPSEVEAAFLHLARVVPEVGVVVDTAARLCVIYAGGETAIFVNLDDGGPPLRRPVPPAVAERLRASDAAAYGLADAARDTLAYLLEVRRRHAAT